MGVVSLTYFFLFLILIDCLGVQFRVVSNIDSHQEYCWPFYFFIL